MSRSSVENWSLMRSLAFLAATFAVMFGTLAPTAVAASAATGSPIMLCSGQQIVVVYVDDEASQPDQPTGMDSLKCSACLLASLVAPPAPPPSRPTTPPSIVAVTPRLIPTPAPPPAAPIALRPPSTAPPTA